MAAGRLDLRAAAKAEASVFALISLLPCLVIGAGAYEPMVRWRAAGGKRGVKGCYPLARRYRILLP